MGTCVALTLEVHGEIAYTVCFSYLCGHVKAIPNMYQWLSPTKKGTALKKKILRDKRIHLQLYIIIIKCGSVRMEGEKEEKQIVSYPTSFQFA